MNDNYKQITFAIHKQDWNKWHDATTELKRRRIFKSQADAFITFIHYISQASDEEIEQFKQNAIILPLELPEEIN
jgi:hypothetical protein